MEKSARGAALSTAVSLPYAIDHKAKAWGVTFLYFGSVDLNSDAGPRGADWSVDCANWPVLKAIIGDTLTTFNQSSPPNWCWRLDSLHSSLPSGTGKQLQRARVAT